MSDRTGEGRRTQADRRAASRSALLEAAARGLSRYGYANLVLEQVAHDAGYSRGALYHQFATKEELALAVVEWVGSTWFEQMGPLFADETDPVAALVSVARGHAVFCRRDIARSMMALRIEFSGQERPVAQAVTGAGERIVAGCARLIVVGRHLGHVPPGPSARVVAAGLVGALEGLVISLAGQAPDDELLAERLVLGLLGVDATLTAMSPTAATRWQEREPSVDRIASPSDRDIADDDSAVDEQPAL